MTHLAVTLAGKLDRDSFRRVFGFEPFRYLRSERRVEDEFGSLGSTALKIAAALSVPSAVTLAAAIAQNLSTNRAPVTTNQAANLSVGLLAFKPGTNFLAFVCSQRIGWHDEISTGRGLCVNSGHHCPHHALTSGTSTIKCCGHALNRP